MTTILTCYVMLSHAAVRIDFGMGIIIVIVLQRVAQCIVGIGGQAY